MNIIKRFFKTRSSTKIYYDAQGRVIDIVSSAGTTRHNRAAYYLHRDMVNRPLRHKLRRRWEYTLDNAVGHIVGSEKAATMPYIGLEEQHG